MRSAGIHAVMDACKHAAFIMSPNESFNPGQLEEAIAAWGTSKTVLLTQVRATMHKRITQSTLEDKKRDTSTT